MLVAGLARSTQYYRPIPVRFPMRKGFLYLVAIVDRFSRYILS
jgi:hypothetical protein